VEQQDKAYLDASNRNFQAQQESFRQDAAVQHQMNNEFINAMQQRTNQSMQRTSDAIQARSTATSDWVDYALDRQTVVNVNTGQTGKISNQVTPGGSLQKVHGDGTQ
jgi:Skp family chaperone for outer membrane proteins